MVAAGRDIGLRQQRNHHSEHRPAWTQALAITCEYVQRTLRTMQGSIGSRRSLRHLLPGCASFRLATPVTSPERRPGLHPPGLRTQCCRVVLRRPQTPLLLDTFRQLGLDATEEGLVGLARTQAGQGRGCSRARSGPQLELPRYQPQPRVAHLEEVQGLSTWPQIRATAAL
jgi:hypothetical protein